MKKSRKAAVRDADKWFSLFIRLTTQLEYKGCPFCGKPIEHCFHFFSRVNYITRWDEVNAIGSCAGCNMEMEYRPFRFYKWFEDYRGREALDALDRKHRQIQKYSTADLIDIAAKFKKLYEELKETNNA